MKARNMIAAILAICFACMACLPCSAQTEKDILIGELCNRMFGSVPESDSINIDASSNRMGQLVFSFSLPEQNVEQPTHSSYPGGISTGVPVVLIKVVPIYSPEVLDGIKDLNDQRSRELGDRQKGGDLQKGRSVERSVEFPQYSHGGCGFYVESPLLLPTSLENRRLLMKEMRQLFSECEYLVTTRSQREFWADCMTHEDIFDEFFKR